MSKKKNPYKTLNVPKDATPEEIKQAYREKAKKEHPDAGGDENAFKDLANAYALLANPQKREYYDHYGDEPQSQDDTLSKAKRLLNELIDQMLAKYTPEQILKTDLIKSMKTAIFANIDKVEHEKNNQNTMMTRLSKLSEIFDERLIHKEKSITINIFKINLDSKKDSIMTNLKALDDQKKILDKAVELLSDFDFNFDKDLDEQLQRQKSAYNSTTSSFFSF